LGALREGEEMEDIRIKRKVKRGRDSRHKYIEQRDARAEAWSYWIGLD
jgi:hypothetical protein